MGSAFLTCCGGQVGRVEPLFNYVVELSTHFSGSKAKQNGQIRGSSGVRGISLAF